VTLGVRGLSLGRGEGGDVALAREGFRGQFCAYLGAKPLVEGA
jgi:hypothetical protein